MKGRRQYKPRARQETALTLNTAIVMSFGEQDYYWLPIASQVTGLQSIHISECNKTLLRKKPDSHPRVFADSVDRFAAMRMLLTKIDGSSLSYGRVHWCGK